MLVIPRQGPFEARQVPTVADFGDDLPLQQHFDAMLDLAAWCNGRAAPPAEGTVPFAYYAIVIDQELAYQTNWIVKIEWGISQFYIYTDDSFRCTFQEFGQLREADQHNG